MRDTAISTLLHMVKSDPTEAEHTVLSEVTQTHAHKKEDSNSEHRGYSRCTSCARHRSKRYMSVTLRLRERGSTIITRPQIKRLFKEPVHDANVTQLVRGRARIGSSALRSRVGVVGRIMSPEDVQVLIPTSYKKSTLHGKGTSQM